MILSKYHSNMMLIRDYWRAVSTGKACDFKNIDFSLRIVALYAKAFGPYP